MDERTLNELLECSVCFNRLDSTSKVLPCQHTFCRQCLEEIVSTKHELRCPECRSLVEIKVENLPSNILLMRLLEGMKTSIGTTSGLTSDNVPPSQKGNASDGYSRSSNIVPATHQPCAKALYNYEAREPGDLTFKKGDVVYLRKQVDENWYHGELNGHYGFFPATYVQVLKALPPQEIPKCTALYDFIIDDENEKDCLTFHKDEVITVIRRIDEHWAEGKLAERIGIFPISFVDLNDAAKWLINNQPIEQQTSSSQRGNSQLSASRQTHVHKVLPGASNVSAQNNTSSCSNNQRLAIPREERQQPNVESNDLCNNIQNDSVSVQNSQNSNCIVPKSDSLRTSSSACPVSASGSSAADSIRNSSSSINLSSILERPSSQASFLLSPSQATKNNLKRHSFTGIAKPSLSLLNSHQRHSLELTGNEILSPIASSSEDASAQCESNILTVTTTSSSATVSTSSSSSAALSSANKKAKSVSCGIFVALYNYKPQKVDEVELTKGAYYLVSEKCQDGWYKGTCLRTGMIGVFPGNYVQMVRLPASMKTSAQHRAAISTPQVNKTSVTSASISGSTMKKPVNALVQAAKSNVSRTHSFPKTSPHHLITETHHMRSASSSGQSLVFKSPSKTITNVTQALSRCTASTAIQSTSSTASSLAQNHKTGAALHSCIQSTEEVTAENVAATSLSDKSHVCANPAASTQSPKSSRRYHHHHSNHSSSPRSHVTSKHSTSQSRNNLDLVKQSDATAQSTSDSRLSSPKHVATAKSTSKSTSEHGNKEGAKASVERYLRERREKKEAREKRNDSILKRLASAGIPLKGRKSRSPPPLDNKHSTHQSSASSSVACSGELEGAVATSVVASSSAASTSSSSHKPSRVKPLIRERYHCVVAYPPQSDIELELKAGDVVYVHKKREDGWFKGTLMRTGKTGLFPSSFVTKF